ncbi:MAG TPA: glucose-6-phosphate dehydrogenase [Candidatus Saccharimonadales bacterium]|nr:glucose-6-phosphate dehydrogenase [Candidatus Saccharimonadales bacterium]
MEDSNGQIKSAGKTTLQPTILVLFGITGDLSKRYILPALYHLVRDGLLPDDIEIIGVSRREVPIKDILDAIKSRLQEKEKTYDQAALDRMQQIVKMYKMDLDDGDDYHALLEFLNMLEEKHGVCMNRLYYLAIPPEAYQNVVKLLGKHQLNTSCQHGNAATRLLVEKPFGFNEHSAQKLIDNINKQFKEKQVYRIDHYLAKETVQNILAFRLHNSIFESLWDNRFILRIDIESKEAIDIEGRATFYEQTGALRDFVQNHLMQLLAITTMQNPKDISSDSIHKTRLKLLNEVEPIPKDKVSERAVRGQYEGYRQEVNDPKSTIETFAALTLFINNKRWQGVPINIRTGKALDEKKTTITVTFKHPEGTTHHPNILTFYIQPHEGIGVDLFVKKPGFADELERVPMDFLFESRFDSHTHPDAYERVMVDAIRGDRTLFASSDEVLASWRIIENVVTAWRASGDGLQLYKKGSTGPKL